MPTYHYKCKECGHEFEELQKISESPLRDCPSCKKPALVRIIGGGAGLLFKGSGFYLTDYKKPPKSPDSPSPETKKSETKKSDPKPDSPKSSDASSPPPPEKPKTPPKKD